MKQQRRYKEPQDTLWGKFLSGFMAVVFAMSTLTLIPIASAINGEPNEAQIQQQEELADQTSGKDEKAAEPAADEQKLEPVELLSIASVEDEDDADDAAPADVTLKVKAQSATVTYNGKDAATELVVPTGKDVKFTVKAADGFTLGAAAVKLADAKGETTLTPNAGEYTVAADRVADGATIVVTAEAATGSANTDAAEPSTPAPSTELGEKANKVKNAISNFIEKLGGATTFAAVGNGNGNNSGTGTYSDELPDIKNWSLEKVVQYFRVEPISVVMSPGDRFSDHGGDNSKPEHQFLSTNPDVSIDKSTQAQAEIQGIPGQTTIIVHAYKGKNEKDWNYQIFVVTLSDNKEDDAALCYDANGGTGTTLATTGTVNSVVKVSANGFTREGYAFDGWNTEADGTGTAYAVGADYKLTKAMDTLYAQWSKDSIGTTDPTQPDGVADKYQATIKYAAGANGSVTGTTTRVVTLMDGGAYVTEATITPGTEGVTVEPDTGYEFDEWTDSDPETAITAMGGETYTYTANFKPASFAYTVEYYVDDAKIEAQEGWPTGGTAEYGTTASVEPANAVEIDETNYMLESTNHSVTIDADAGKNVIKVVYTKDSIGTTDPTQPDGVADKYQATVTYEVVNGAFAQDAATTQVVTFTKDGANVAPGTEGAAHTALSVPASAANDGYTGGTWAAKDANGALQNGQPATVTGDATFEIAYEIGSFAYTVEYYVDDAKIEAQEGWPTGGTAEYGTTASVEPANAVEIDETNYMLESTNHSVTIDADAGKNVIKVVYTKDSIGTTDPTQPDGVADKYQATIKYAAGANGSVTGTTTRVVTLMDGGAYVTEATITPGTEGVTVEPDTGYEFDEWTDSDPETAITAMGGETYTYTANFKGDFTAISATPYEGVFDGAYHTPTVNGTIEGDKVSFSADHRNVTNGPATVTITVTRGAETYTIGSTVTITPRPVVVTANDASKIYGEADPTLTAAVRGIEGNTASGLVGNDTVAYTVSRATGEDAGEYDITATGNAVQGNYAVTYMPATFTITAAGGNVVTADNIAGADGLTKMYDGQVASVEAEAARSGSTLLYSTDGVSFTTQNPVFTNVGSYDVYVMATNPNYEDTPVVRTTVTITPAPVTVTVGNAAKTAGAVDPTFAATVTGLVNGESAGLISYALTRTAGEDAGSYVITAAGDRVQGNYIVTYVPGTLVITAALVPPAALPAGPAAPAAVAALDTILDDGVPLATIDDDENALAAFEEIHCWTHWLMIFGALVTIVYGLAVLYRRRHGIRDMDDFEGDIMGGRKYDAAAEKNPAAGNAFQAM